MPRLPTEPDSRALVSAIHENHVDHRDKPGDDELKRAAVMDWLRRWRLRQAAKQYARRLGPHLQHAYGASEHYTAAQIRTAVGKLGLDPKFIAFGYAGFLAEAECEAAVSTAPLHIPFAEARELFERFRPTRLADSTGFYESRIGMQGPHQS